MSIIGVGAVIPVAARDAQAQGTAAMAPPNDNAYLFNTFAQNSTDVSTFDSIKGMLQQEHYKVKEYNDSANGVGNATIFNLFNLNQAGILIIDSHGGVDLEVYGKCKYPVNFNPISVVATCQPFTGQGLDPAWKLADNAANDYNSVYGAGTVEVVANVY